MSLSLKILGGILIFFLTADAFTQAGSGKEKKSTKDSIEIYKRLTKSQLAFTEARLRIFDKKRDTLRVDSIKKDTIKVKLADSVKKTM